jgi:hypothetical protein
MTVPELMERLLAEFPSWSNAQAFHVATGITETAERMSFQLEAERGLAEIPVAGHSVRVDADPAYRPALMACQRAWARQRFGRSW